MTCVIGYKRKGTVWLSADSVAVDFWYEAVTCRTPKVWRADPFVVGASGSWRCIQLLRHQVDWKHLAALRQEHESLEAFVCRAVVPAVQKTFEQHHFQIKEDERATHLGDILLGIVFLSSHTRKP